jgi:hypothetical protein
MQATFHLHSSELTEEFCTSLRTMFAGRSLELIVQDATKHELMPFLENASDAFEEIPDDTDGLDETERIRRNPKLHAAIMESLRQANAGNLISVDINKIIAGASPEEAIIDRKVGMAP